MSVDNDAAKSDGFICGAWTIREQGPILNYEQPYIREQYVYRCDLPAGHEGDHVDSVLLTNWSGPTPEEVAKAKAAKAEAEVDVETRWRVVNKFRDWCETFDSETEAMSIFNKPYNKNCIRVERLDTTTTVVATKEAVKVDYQGKDK